MIEQMLEPLLVKPGESRLGEALDVMGIPVYVKVSGEDTDGQMASFYTLVPPMSGPPLHRHSREDEYFYVLSGEITWEVDGQRLKGGKGAFVMAPRGSAHTFQNFSNSTAEMLVMVTPSGLENFFEDIARANAGLMRPDLAKSEKIMRQYGIEMLDRR